MTGAGPSSGPGCGSPCGACKFLRRRCVQGCVFAPYFCHEQGATHFAVIHKVFGASNVSKLLTQLPVSDRSEAAITISYEAQARLHDPIYGCVSHIFALQQQVVSLQAQLASLKEHASQGMAEASTSASPNLRYYGKVPSNVQEWQSWPHRLQNQDMPQHDQNHTENASYARYEEASQYSMPSLGMETSNVQWTLDDADALQSIAFRYSQNL